MSDEIRGLVGNFPDPDAAYKLEATAEDTAALLSAFSRALDKRDARITALEDLVLEASRDWNRVAAERNEARSLLATREAALTLCTEMRDGYHRAGNELIAERDAKIAELKARLAEAQKLYSELLYGVESKFPGETRYQTALRYIKNAERGDNSAASVAQEDKS